MRGSAAHSVTNSPCPTCRAAGQHRGPIVLTVAREQQAGRRAPRAASLLRHRPVDAASRGALVGPAPGQLSPWPVQSPRNRSRPSGSPCCTPGALRGCRSRAASSTSLRSQTCKGRAHWPQEGGERDLRIPMVTGSTQIKAVRKSQGSYPLALHCELGAGQRGLHRRGHQGLSCCELAGGPHRALTIQQGE